MTFYVSKPTTDALIAYIEANFQTYLDLVATASAVTLAPLTNVDRGGADFESKHHLMPFCLIEPLGMEISDELPTYVEIVLRYDILLAVDGFQESDALTLLECYQDAFVAMTLSDDTLSGAVDHISVKNIEQFPGGSGTTKYAILAVEVTVTQGR